MFRPLRLDVGPETREDGLIQRRKIVADDRLAGGDCDALSCGHGEDAAAHCAITPPPIAAFPADYGDCEAGQEIRMMWEDAKAAAGVFCAQREHAVLLHYDTPRCDGS